MAWTVTIYKDSGSLAINADVRFDINPKKNVNDSGEVLSVDYEINVEGVLADPTPATVGASMVTYSELVTNDALAQRVVIAQDGVTRWDLKPEDGFIGPYVMDFASKESDKGGSGYNQWHYSFVIIFKAKGNASGGGETVYELHTSCAVTEKNKKIVRKVWKAEARGTSSSSALSAVKSFTPPEKFITQETEEFFRDNKASGVWIWDATISASGVKTWICKVTYRPGGPGYIDRPSAGANADPVFYKKQIGKTVVDVSGTIISNDKDIPRPSAHFAESEDFHRAWDEERSQLGPEIHGDPRNGEYRLDYNEVWYCKGTPASPKHSDSHNVISLQDAPATGGVAQ